MRLAQAAADVLFGSADENLGVQTDDREVAIAAVEASLVAGLLQLESLGELQSSSIRTKSSTRDLVSRVDLECERAIVQRIRAACPTDEIEAEEETSDEVGDAPRWFVDPLDGTVNYIHGIPMFCVSIARYVDGVGQLGVVYAPRVGELFVAAHGRGAFVIDVDQHGEQASEPCALKVRATEDLSEAVLATGFPYRRGELEHSNLENLQRFFYDVRGVRRMGSAAIDLAYVAAGRLDGYWELHLSPFDLAAGAVLVREAGGTLTDASGGEDWLRAGHLVVAGTAALASEMRARIVH